MNEVRCRQLAEERWDDVREEYDTLWNMGTNQVEGGGEDDDIEYIVDQSYAALSAQIQQYP